MVAPIPAAVIGVGYLGRFHAQKYQALPQAELLGVVDVDGQRAREVAAELGVAAYTDAAELLPRVRAVSVAATTRQHHALVRQCLAAGVHVLVEKPIASTAAEAAGMVALAAERGCVLQVGHLERFNPAYRAVRRHLSHPLFVEAVRIAGFKERGHDVDVVLDLMSHDLDLVLSMVNAPLESLHAVGVPVVTGQTDLANARLVFADGCVANLTASRISPRAERKLRIFQETGYFSLDLAAPAARVYHRERGTVGPPEVPMPQEVALKPADALLAEVEAFLEAVGRGTAPVVSGRDGLANMELAEQIMRDIHHNRPR